MSLLPDLAAVARALVLAGEPAPLPGFGTLRRFHVAARVQTLPDGTRRLEPPRETIRLALGRGPDPTALAEAFGARIGTTPLETPAALRRAIDELEGLLAARGEVVLPGLGTVRRSDRSLLFGPDPQLLAKVNQSYEGLPAVGAAGDTAGTASTGAPATSAEAEASANEPTAPDPGPTDSGSPTSSGAAAPPESEGVSPAPTADPEDERLDPRDLPPAQKPAVAPEGQDAGRFASILASSQTSGRAPSAPAEPSAFEAADGPEVEDPFDQIVDEVMAGDAAADTPAAPEPPYAAPAAAPEPDLADDLDGVWTAPMAPVAGLPDVAPPDLEDAEFSVVSPEEAAADPPELAPDSFAKGGWEADDPDEIEELPRSADGPPVVVEAPAATAPEPLAGTPVGAVEAELAPAEGAQEAAEEPTAADLGAEEDDAADASAPESDDSVEAFFGVSPDAPSGDGAPAQPTAPAAEPGLAPGVSDAAGTAATGAAIAAAMASAGLTELEPDPETSAAVASAQAVEPPRRRWGWLVGVLFVAALIALALFAWPRLRGDRSEPRPTPEVIAAMPEAAPAEALPDSAVADAIGDSLAAFDAEIEDALDDLSTAPPDEAEPATVPTPPTPALEVEPDPEPPAAAPAAPAAAAPSASRPPTLFGPSVVAATQDGYTWIVASVGDRAAAIDAARRYREQGYRSGVLPTEAGGGVRYRVALGLFPTEAAALAVRGLLPADVRDRDDVWYLNLSNR